MLLRLFITILLFHQLAIIKDTFALASAACKKKIINHVQYNHNKAISGQEKCTLIMKYILWKSLLNGTEKDINKYISFLNNKENSNWPRLSTIKKNLERRITLANIHKVPSYIINNPTLAETSLIYLSFLSKTKAKNKDDLIRQFTRKYWQTITFSNNEQHKTFLRKYEKFLRPIDHKKRSSYLLKSRQHTWLIKILKKLPKQERRYIKAILALRRLDTQASHYIAKLPKTLLNDQLLTIERIRWRRINDYFDSACELLYKLLGSSKPLQPQLQKRLWSEQVILAREAINKDRPQSALRILSKNKYRNISKQTEENFLKGWIRLNMMSGRDNYIKAFKHLAIAASIAKSPVYKSKLYYWTALAASSAGFLGAAKQYLELAAKDFTSFYGQLAHKELDKKIKLNWRISDYSITKKEQIIRQLLQRSKFHKIAAIIADIGGDQDMAYEFIRTQLHKVKTQKDLDELVIFCEKYIPIYTCWIITIVDFKLHKNYKEFYPTLPVEMIKPQIDINYIYALIKQESGFWYKAKSPAGAMGVMQLMPATAKFMAKKLRVKFSKAKLLDDISYNILLGQSYLKKMLKDNSGNTVHAFAAYNAGPHNVKKWKQRHSYQKYSKLNWLNSIELIPFGETRTYVEKLHANKLIYDSKLL